MGRLTSSSSGGSVSIISGDNVARVNPDGSINVNVVTGGGGLPESLFNEITNVSVGLETTILSYTVQADEILLTSVYASGQNIGEVRVYKNGSLIDKQYLYYMGFNLNFDFNNTKLVNGDLIVVKGVNSGVDVCNFNARIQLIGA